MIDRKGDNYIMKKVIDNKVGYAIMNSAHTEIYSGNWPNDRFRKISELGNAMIRVFRNKKMIKTFVDNRPEEIGLNYDIVEIMQTTTIIIDKK